MKRTSIPAKTRAAVIGDNPTCHWCGYAGIPAEFDADHILPVALGGKNTRSNLVPSCSRCNRARGKKDPSRSREWTFVSQFNRMSPAARLEEAFNQMSRARQAIRA